MVLMWSNEPDGVDGSGMGRGDEPAECPACDGTGLRKANAADAGDDRTCELCGGYGVLLQNRDAQDG
jgi:DnaJ-class molecular chaperone